MQDMITRGQEARRREKQGLGKSVKGDDEVCLPLFKWFWQLNTVYRLYSDQCQEITQVWFLGEKREGPINTLVPPFY